jgi:hypothetical protein
MIRGASTGLGQLLHFQGREGRGDNDVEKRQSRLLILRNAFADATMVLGNSWYRK